jgi:hypothetical protein
MAASKGKRQVALLTNRQFGSEVFHNVLRQISSVASGVRDIFEKGTAVDTRTQQQVKLRCSVHDIKTAGSPEQLGAIEEFISVWAQIEEPPPTPPKPPKVKKPRKK